MHDRELSQAALEVALDAGIREIADFPSPGVLFRDVSPLLAAPDGLAIVTSALAQHVRTGEPVDFVAGIESRGFFFAVPLALELGVGFVALRKAGKLPGDLHSTSYDLEYGSATLELQVDLIPSGSRVLLVDDVLATGGTVCAALRLLRKAQAHVSEIAVVLELADRGGRAAVAACDGAPPVHALRQLGRPID